MTIRLQNEEKEKEREEKGETTRKLKNTTPKHKYIAQSTDFMETEAKGM